MSEDLEEHLPILSRVIGQLGLYGDIAEEAYSEGLVKITEAAQKYDPNRNVSLAAWLAMNIRWDLKSWLGTHYRQSHHLYLDHTTPSPKSSDENVEFKDMVDKMDNILSEQERQVLWAGAMGYNGRQISKVLKISEVQVSRIKKKAQEKLKAGK